MSGRSQRRQKSGVSRFRADLRETVSRMWVLDSHEHLMFPKEHEALATDCFYLTNHYLNCDLVSAGMPEASMRSLVDTTVPLDARWASFAPFWEVARTTGYGQAVERAISGLYGLAGLSASTYRDLSDRVAQTAGQVDWYEHVLKSEGRFIASVMDVGSTRGDRRYFLPVMRLDKLIVARTAAEFASAVALPKVVASAADAPATLGACLAALDATFDRYVGDGIVGIKCGLAYRRTVHFRQVERPIASRLYDRAVTTGIDDDEAVVLQDFLFHEVCDQAGARNLPYQIHTGLQNGNWSADISITDPTLLTNTLKAHPSTRFDLFHGGYPFSSALATIGKNFPNAFINACWLAIISPSVLERALHEWLDTVPHNKIQAFGGDYRMPELACAHGWMARDIVSDVIADRVEKGWLAEVDALTLADRLLRTNGLALFRVPTTTVARNIAPLG